MADLALCSGEELRQAVHLSYLVDTGLNQGMVRKLSGSNFKVGKEGWIEESPKQKNLRKKLKKKIFTPKNVRVL